MARSCSVAGCPRPYHARGLCRFHYVRDTTRGTCSAAGCGKPIYVGGLCGQHYWRQKTWGHTESWREHFLRDHPPAGGIGLIHLRNRRVAVVDAEDYCRVIGHRWYTNRAAGREFVCSDFGGRQVALTHFLLGLPPGKRVLFRDKDPLNCRRKNLVVATQQQLNFNQRAQRRGKTSRYKGVSRVKGTERFEAYVNRDGHRYWLGTFESEREAAAAYDEKARELFGPFARLNFPDPGEQPALPEGVGAEAPT
jgi:hypothetical protein